MNPKRIGLVGFDGVTALHLIGPADAFLAAALDDGYGGRISCYEVCIIGAPSEFFRSESGLTFAAAANLETAPECDTIIVAGGTGLRHQALAEQLADWLLQRSGDTRRLGSVCGGVAVMAATGLLDGREVSTHWRIARALSQRFPRIRIDHRKPWVCDGRYYTCNGLDGGINLALAMIQEDYGPYVARAVAQELSIFSIGNGQHADTRLAAPATNQSIDRFADIVGWIVRNLHSDLSVQALARRACMCPTHFSKAFKSVFGQPPAEFVENLRLNEACRRLTKRQKTVQSVAASVGFSDAASFQRAFQRRFGRRPSKYLEPARPKRSLSAAQSTSTDRSTESILA
jgi:transcriptional regulator GlxA family with amidase domain